jgi:uncharacterized protein (TIGR03382 family)
MVFLRATRCPAVVLGVLLALGGGATARADFVNGGFEAGTQPVFGPPALNGGWYGAGAASAATSSFFSTRLFEPLAGSYMGVLATHSGSESDGLDNLNEVAAALGTTAAALNAFGGSDPFNFTGGSLLQQTIAVAAGDTARFNYRFATLDADSQGVSDDKIFVSVRRDGVLEQLLLLDPGQLTEEDMNAGFFRMDDWGSFSFPTALLGGEYTFSIALLNQNEVQTGRSELYVDAAQLDSASAIPAPPAVVLAALGALGLLARRRRA